MYRAFEENSLDILHFFERRVDPREDAADLLSETMLVAWQKVGSLPVDPLEARMWLFVTARYTLMGYRRGRRKQPELASVLRRSLAVTGAGVMPACDGFGAEVADLLRGLPDDLGEILRLVHWDGFSVDEASLLLKVSRATGRRRYDRAKATLRQSLEADEPSRSAGVAGDAGSRVIA